MEIGLMYRWGGMVPGREEEGLKLFGEVTQFLTEAKKNGTITYFEPFLFSTGDCHVENGFFLVKGPREAIQRLMDDEKYMELLVRSNALMEHFRVEFLVTSESIPKIMELSAKAIRQPALAR